MQKCHHIFKNVEFNKIMVIGKDQNYIFIPILGLQASVIICLCHFFSRLCRRSRFHYDPALRSHSSSYSFFFFFLSFFLLLFSFFLV
jgi:hypothetical protein